jgi:predicted RNA-binding protein with RPS1 domain
VNGIKNNDIRYANSSDRSLAENLRDFLKTEKDIQIKDIQIEDKNLIDLSTKGYKVPPGQLEIWLKD